MSLSPGAPGPLTSLVSPSESASGDRVVAVGPNPSDTRDLAALRADVDALASALAADRGERWLVQTEDAWRVAVAFLAAARIGARLALPPNLQAGTLEELASRSARILVDASSPSVDDPRAQDPIAPIAPPVPIARLAPNAPGVEGPAPSGVGSEADVDRTRPLVDLFTSGTSGPGKQVTKTLAHLEDEVVELERALGDGLDPDATVLATVPTHHLYGLLFRVLWPLASGRPFHRTSVLHPDELIARIAQAGRAIVVSSPAHLRHLAASPRLDDVAPRLGAVFSSGGPLETTTALALAGRLGHAPLEIFGSTETGGVAFRRASVADPSPRWTPFAPVRVEIDPDDGRILVRSPFVSAASDAADTSGPADTSDPANPTTPPDSAWRMGDRARTDGDGFRLLGRSDRIAKVGEKTLSLPEMEDELTCHDLVETAVVGTWTTAAAARSSGRGVQRLGAIVVPSAEGRLHLAGQGRRALASVLAAHLAARWDRVLLPRRWRFVDGLPVDARGKVSQDVFETEMARPVVDPRDPLLVNESRKPGGDSGSEQVTLRFVVPRDLAYFSGHYDAFPLVPGVVQIHWVMRSIARVLGRTATATGMEAVKFKNVLRPGQAFTMTLDLAGRDSSKPTRVAFTLAAAADTADGDEADARVFSSGRITLSH